MSQFSQSEEWLNNSFTASKYTSFIQLIVSPGSPAGIINYIDIASIGIKYALASDAANAPYDNLGHLAGMVSSFFSELLFKFKFTIHSKLISISQLN